MIIKGEHGETKTEDIIALDKSDDKISDIGLSLPESKALLKTLQKMIVSHQAEHFTKAHIAARIAKKSDKRKAITPFYSERYLVQYRYPVCVSIVVIVKT